MRSAIVLGAGMAGLGTALHLQQRGWSVVLVDRGEPGRETSFGNAGIIQAEAVEPYAMPRDRASLWAIARGRSNDVHYEVRHLPRHLGALARYWWHSAPRRHAAASRAYATLIAQAIPEHAALIAEAGADDLVRRGGFRILYRERRALDAAATEAERLRAAYGVRARILTPAELATAEPALKRAGEGAVHWEDPWSVRDPGALAAAYAALFTRHGGVIARGEADSLRPGPRGWRVRTADGPVEAAAAVVALGPWSPDLLRRFGYRIAMVKKRGYHRHWRGARTLDLPLLDVQNGTVLAPMAAGLRLTTGAELAGPEAATEPVQLARAEAAARDLLDLDGPRENAPWSGTRPCLPDMLPMVGEAPRHPGLWFNFGHGHQGFTLGPTTGRLLSEIMSGETPLVPAAPFRPGR